MTVLENYDTQVKEAVELFWKTRDTQKQRQLESEIQDAGMRGAVTGGKQMDGFIHLLKQISIDSGVSDEYIYIKGNKLPGFFRPTKDWDFLIVSPKKHLISCIEFKSQVGSFGNNFNNRTEEALGTAVDIWTAFREGAFPNQEAPWIGYLLVVERKRKSSIPVKVRETHFKVFKEFIRTSYLDRYKILCKKLMLERHYNSASMIWTSNNLDSNITYGYMDNELSFDRFVESFVGFLRGKMSEFE